MTIIVNLSEVTIKRWWRKRKMIVNNASVHEEGIMK
jgi:hypothetical protein